VEESHFCQAAPGIDQVYYSIYHRSVQVLKEQEIKKSVICVFSYHLFYLDLSETGQSVLRKDMQ